MTTGKIIRELRLAKEMSQADLAKATGLSTSAIAMYERGQRQPKREYLEAIADYFNVDMAYLLGLETKSTYLMDPKDIVLQKAFDEIPEMRMLFSAAEGAPVEDLIQAREYILFLQAQRELKKKNNKE